MKLVTACGSTDSHTLRLKKEKNKEIYISLSALKDSIIFDFSKIVFRPKLVFGNFQYFNYFLVQV